jgi:hypothetical protein
MEEREPMPCLEPGCDGEMRPRKLKATVGDPLDGTQELAFAFARVMGPPPFECDRCGHREGYYSAIGRRMITVEPLE